MVLLGAQLADGAATEREVDARLDGERVVGVEEGLEGSDELSRV